ncbi:MAG: hypothetical protein J2P17_04085, partial [Mycobacterium sp.]|nr:hypothetical protein [Mycobacterium sp.]
MAGRGNDGTTPPRRRRLLRGLIVLGACAALAGPSVAHAGTSLPPADPTHNPLLTLQDKDVSIGVDLHWGGALSVLIDKKTGRNLINRHDVGRLVQQSYYGAGKYAGCDFGLNPVQGGDSAGNESGVQAATKEHGTVYVRSRPLDWCLNGQHPDVTYENWYTLEGSAVHVVARATFRNVAHGGIRSQEWPAIFTIPQLNNYVRYDGDQPFTGGALSSSTPGFPNETQSNTEGWGSHVDTSGRGLGWFVPNVFTSTNYNYTGQGGTGDLADATSYSAPIPSVSLSTNSVFQYDYWLVAGTPDDVRKLASTQWAPSQSVWEFDHADDRQMWSASADVDGDGPGAAGW